MDCPKCDDGPITVMDIEINPDGIIRAVAYECEECGYEHKED